MSKTLHIQLASDCYLLHFSFRDTSFSRMVNISFALRGHRDKHISHYHEQKLLHTKALREGALFITRNTSLSLINEYGLRLVGHVDGFANGQKMLVDVTLRQQTKHDALSLYKADGTLLIGNEEFLFSQAHSAALLFTSSEANHHCWLGAYSYCGIPSVVAMRGNEKQKECTLLSADQRINTAEMIVTEQETQECIHNLTQKLMYRFPEKGKRKCKELCNISGQIETKNNKKVSLYELWLKKL